MKKLIALLLALAMVFALCACGSSSSSAPAAEEPAAEEPVADSAEEPAAEAEAEEPAAEEAAAEPAPAASDLTIAVSTIAYSIAVLPQVLIDNLQVLCEDNGWKFNMLAAEGDAELQGEQISTLVSTQPDYLVIFPADPILAIDWCEEAAEAGVPVICMHVDVDESCKDDGTCVAYCGINNKAVASSIADYMFEKNGEDAALNIVEIGGVPVQADYIVRTGTFNAAIEGTSYSQLGDIAWAYSSRADAKGYMENFISSYGDQINILVGFDDDLTMGGVSALQDNGMTDVQVYSITGQKEAMAAIQDGTMTMTVFTPTKAIAQKVVDTINSLEAGQSVDYYQYIDAPIVDSSNVDQYVDQAEF